MRLLADPRLFPILSMILFACAAVRYALAGNWGQVTYWVSAIALNYAVTFMMGSGQ